MLKFFVSILMLSIFSCSQVKETNVVEQNEPRNSVKFSLTEFPISGTNIRALEVINDSTVWFAGSNGKWGFTNNNGKTWKVDSLKDGKTLLNFRSISVTENGNVFLVSIAEPAAVFKSLNKGKTWKKVYTDTVAKAFFDAVDFWDNENGILLGDVQNGCFHLAITKDGGDTWKKVECSEIPLALGEENPYAASNTNIAISGTHAWFGTGGKSGSRVYHTPDLGQSWEVQNTPIVFGQTMTGIYSIDFYDELNGIIAGGNWDSVNQNTQNFAVTEDGGNNWELVVNEQKNSYVSCAQFVPDSKGNEFFTLSGRMRGGESSMGFSGNAGETWQVFKNENYVSIRFANKKVAWLSGKEKIAKLVFE